MSGGVHARLALAIWCAAGLLASGCARVHLGAPLRRPFSVPDRACPPEGVVDRIEGDLAVVVRDGGIVVTCPARGLHEGEVLRDGRPDPVATRRLAADVARARRRLGADDDGKDLGL